MQGISYIICCTGTTAFPLPNGMRDINPQANEFQRLVEWSKVYFNSDYRRARSLNSPEQVDAEGLVIWLLLSLKT
jgi:hypothetical protein